MNMPVSLIADEEHYRILAGFSRVEIARDLGLDQIPVKLVDISSIEDTFYALLLEHISCSDLHLLEKARILHILDSLAIDVFNKESRFLEVLGLPRNPSLLSDMLRLLDLQPEVLDYLARYDTAFKQAGLFFPLSLEEQGLMVNLAAVLQVRPIELQEIATQFVEIGRRENISMHALYDDLEFPQLLESRDSRGRKLTEMRERLFRRRNPRLTQWNGKIEQARKRMKLPPGALLKWDKSLERPGITLQTTFKSQDDVAEFTEAIQKPVIPGAFREIFEVL